MSDDGDLDGGGGGDGVLGPGNVLIIVGDGGESMLGMKSENKFLALANILPLPLVMSEGIAAAAAAAGGGYGTGLWGGNPRATGRGGTRLLILAGGGCRARLAGPNAVVTTAGRSLGQSFGMAYW